MRGEIEQSGESLLERGELNLLCMGELSENHRWNMIADIAINEGWSFTFSLTTASDLRNCSPWRFSDCCYNRSESR
jgi:hypothetical protein